MHARRRPKRWMDVENQRSKIEKSGAGAGVDSKVEVPVKAAWVGGLAGRCSLRGCRKGKAAVGRDRAFLSWGTHLLHLLKVL